MSALVELRERLLRFYAAHSGMARWAGKLVFGILVFYHINDTIGFVEVFATPFVTIGLAILCMFLPVTAMLLFAVALIMVHMAGLSVMVAAFTGLVFVVMFCFYFQYTRKKAILVLLMPVLFWLRIPYLLLVACGLLEGSICFVPIAFGTITYFMMDYVKDYADSLTGEEGVGSIEHMTSFAQKLMQNKEMWLMVAVFAICILLVHKIKKSGVDNAWSIAVIAGAVSNVAVICIGKVFLGVEIAFLPLLLGSVVSVVIALVLQFFFFSVDYSRTEWVEYEDDEYYYYVKAVPKISLSTSKKSVKYINRQKEEETQKKEKDPIVKRASQKENLAKPNTDELLLTRSLRKDLENKL